jgi:hypothetical protein
MSRMRIFFESDHPAAPSCSHSSDGEHFLRCLNTQPTNSAMRTPPLGNQTEETCVLPDVGRDGPSLRNHLLQIYRSEDSNPTNPAHALPCPSSTCDMRALSPWPDFRIAWPAQDDGVTLPQHGARLCDSCTHDSQQIRDYGVNTNERSRLPERRSKSMPTITTLGDGGLDDTSVPARSAIADSHGRKRGPVRAHFAEDSMASDTTLRRASTSPPSTKQVQSLLKTKKWYTLEQSSEDDSDSEGELFSTSS